MHATGQQRSTVTVTGQSVVSLSDRLVELRRRSPLISLVAKSRKAGRLSQMPKSSPFEWMMIASKKT